MCVPIRGAWVTGGEQGEGGGACGAKEEKRGRGEGWGQEQELRKKGASESLHIKGPTEKPLLRTLLRRACVVIRVVRPLRRVPK